VVVDETTGEETEKKIEGEELLFKDLYGRLEKTAAMFIKYLKFKERVKLVPLVQDRAL